MSYTIANTFWITEDGSYGGGDVILTSEDDFTEEQLETLGNLNDNDRFEYAIAVLNGEDTSDWDD